ncbi:MAG: hypothetical protein SFU85_07750 [Candidatus Methylacidiphilales bacterium]|nr:hypothetical protein [Candidatus Methylacidiphilales bacterium]
MTLTIRSRSHDYSVEEASHLAEAVARVSACGPVFALVDDFARGPAHVAAFAGIPPENIHWIKADEAAKSFDQIAPIMVWLLERGFRRDAILLAVGGGVVQDIACFIATVMLRGVKWHLIPTTLLAQCDSCIGSKSSINIGRFKNQVGTFYPPNSISLVPAVLAGLPREERVSGLGEAIKLHLIAGPEKWAWLLDRLGAFDQPDFQLGPIIWSCLEIKKPFIEEDEFDRGRRNLLNYGHTFGHAYESATAYAIPHGIAVTLGILTATHISERIGWLPQGQYREMLSLLTPFFAPYQTLIKGAELDKITGAMKWDKKNTGGRIHCILTRGPGKMEKTDAIPPEDLARHMGSFLETLP